MEELSATACADAALSAKSCPIRAGDVDLIVPNRVVAVAHVAGMAGRHQIRGIVVQLVPIKVGADQRSTSGPIARFPIHRCATPVTGMRPGTDSVPEH